MCDVDGGTTQEKAWMRTGAGGGGIRWGKRRGRMAWEWFSLNKYRTSRKDWRAKVSITIVSSTGLVAGGFRNLHSTAGATSLDVLLDLPQLSPGLNRHLSL